MSLPPQAKQIITFNVTDFDNAAYLPEELWQCTLKITCSLSTPEILMWCGMPSKPKR